MRRQFIALITFVGGAFFLLEFLLPDQPTWAPWMSNPLTPYLQLATNLVIILGTMAFLLGPINLVRGSLNTIYKQKKGWVGSAVFLVFMFGAIGVTIMKDQVLARQRAEAAARVVETPPEEAAPPPIEISPGEEVPPVVDATPVESPDVAIEREQKTAAAIEGTPAVDVVPEKRLKPFWVQVYNLFFYGILQSFGGSSMALLAFYLVSAAFRSFRFQSLDAGVMMITAVIVLIGLAPLADLITGALPEYLRPNTWAQWVLDVPNVAVQRAVAFGVCAGAFAVGARYWLSIGTRQE